MKPTTTEGDAISILCVGRDRRNLAALLGQMSLPHRCDWVDGGEAVLKQDYHDVAIVYLGDRAKTHHDPLPEPTRAGLQFVGSTGIPTVILGNGANRALLEGMNGSWDWEFVEEAEAEEDPYQLLRGMRKALSGYLRAAENRETCHRSKALSRISEHFLGAMPWV